MHRLSADRVADGGRHVGAGQETRPTAGRTVSEDLAHVDVLELRALLVVEHLDSFRAVDLADA
jgi:hypothetical protein